MTHTTEELAALATTGGEQMEQSLTWGTDPDPDELRARLRAARRGGKRRTAAYLAGGLAALRRAEFAR